jgi:hypothetical protein
MLLDGELAPALDRQCQHGTGLQDRTCVTAMHSNGVRIPAICPAVSNGQLNMRICR